MAIAAVVPVASRNWLEHYFSNLADEAGVTINGSRPWDIQVHDRRAYRRVAFGGSLGLGESYMDGWWDVPALDQFFYRVGASGLVSEVAGSPLALIGRAKSWLVKEGAKRLAFDVGRAHYDLGNDLFEAMLDKRMVYTCGYWREGVTALDEAQEAKLDLVCRKIGLKRGDRVLDIGCGWGSFAKFAAERYGASVVGITISEEQAHLARERCKAYRDKIEIRLQDYRDMNERFDHVVSLGMFEHVGPAYYRTYFDVVARCLKPRGYFLLHTIGYIASTGAGDPWLSKYIFPHGVLPSRAQIMKAVEGIFDAVPDWQDFGVYYDTTLMAWFENFDAAWPELKKKYDERFYRMWKYYLLSCAGLFRAGQTQLWQILMQKQSAPEVYKPVR